MHILKYQMFIAAALLAGVAIGYFVKDEPIPAEEPKAEEVAKKPVADKGEEASIKALRRRIAELEKLLAEKNGKSEIAISNAVAEAAKLRPSEPPRLNWRERMEEMKKNDPERYTQMTNRFANWRRSRAEQAQNKIDFLSSIDTSHMSASAKRTHAALQDLITKREEIEEQLQQPDLADDQRHSLMEQLRDMRHQIQRLNGEERMNLISEVANSLGFEGEDAKEVTLTLIDVVQATDEGYVPHHGGHRGPPPGGQGGR